MILSCKCVLVNKEVSHFIDILFAQRDLLRLATARILSSSLIYKEFLINLICYTDSFLYTHTYIYIYIYINRFIRILYVLI